MKISRSLAIALSMLILPVSKVDANPLTPDETTLFVMDCETNLRLQLDNPDSYERISFDPVTQDAGTLAEFMGVELPEKAKLVEASNAKDEVLRVDRRILASGYAQGEYIRDVTTIHYRSKEKTGAVSENSASCSEYIGTSTSYSETGGDPRVNGYNQQELMDRRVAKTIAESAALLAPAAAP